MRSKKMNHDFGLPPLSCMRRVSLLPILLITAFTIGCVVDNGGNGNAPASGNTPVNRNDASPPAPAPGSPTAVEPIVGEEAPLSTEEIERGRMSQDWKKYVSIETAGQQTRPATGREKWQDLSPERVNSGQMQLPLSGDVAGPSVFRAQVLLDRVRFSPGIIDGKWGKNTEKAVYWLQKREGLAATGQVDEKTFQRLIELAGNPDRMVIEHRLSEQDVAGPFVDIPENIYEKAKMECMCYESLEEKLAEMFHTSTELLQQLNPNVKLNELKAGDTINVPNLRPANEGATGDVARIVVSDGGHYVHALDAGGRILYHFPSTLGSKYEPSPTGEYKITAIAENPTWHYQPELLGESANKEDALIPAGPNNAVGKVWMALSKPHFGIHGTNAPQTIGYVTSSGCVRLTNWDAVFLASRVKVGTPVEFKDIGAPREAAGR